MSSDCKYFKGSGKTLFFILSGDGGFSNFSQDLSTSLNKLGNDVILLNSKSYFSDKRDVKTVADDLLYTILKSYPNGIKINFLGYSFGADVLPFISSYLSPNLLAQINAIFLLAPSESTDFRVHYSDMLGLHITRGMDVVKAVNELNILKIYIISSAENLPVGYKKIKRDKFYIIYLEGGHKFENSMPKLIEKTNFLGNQK
jgi:type IV secretory pathway VirJ component